MRECVSYFPRWCLVYIEISMTEAVKRTISLVHRSLSFTTKWSHRTPAAVCGRLRAARWRAAAGQAGSGAAAASALPGSTPRGCPVRSTPPTTPVPLLAPPLLSNMWVIVMLVFSEKCRQKLLINLTLKEYKKCKRKKKSLDLVV